MLGEKFYISLSSLDKIELNTFIRYSKSNFINKKTEITLTIELYKRNKTNFECLLQNEKIIFKQIFANEEFDRSLLKNLFHNCIRLFEDYIVFYVSKTNEEQRLAILANFYAKKNMQKEALATNTKLHNIVKKYKLNYKNYYKLFKINMNRFEILLNDFNYETFHNAETAISYLDQYYFLEKIRITQELRTDSIMSNRKYDIKLLDEIKEEIKKDESLKSQLLFKIYSITSDLYEGILDKNTYKILKDLILSNINNFDFYTKKMLFSELGNYITILFNKTADNSLLIEVFENNKNQIIHKTFISNGKIVDANFSQIINVGLALKEFDWVNSFIEQYAIYLYNDGLVLLNKAMVLYTQECFDEALNLLQNVELKTPKINYELKSLYAKILFAKKNYEDLETHLYNFELYIRRNKQIGELIRENNLKFILYLKRLMKNIVNDSKLKKLRKDLEIDKSVFNRTWLIKNIDNLL